MTGYIEEDPRYDLVKELTSKCIEEVSKVIPESRILVVLESPTIKHMASSSGMPMHEILGLLNTASNRIGMLDLDDIKLRSDAMKLKEEQELKLQAIASNQTPN